MLNTHEFVYDVQLPEGSGLPRVVVQEKEEGHEGRRQEGLVRLQQHRHVCQQLQRFVSLL